MIKKLHIKNFKALRDVNFNLSNINIFTGLNGMGKSTVLQSLLLLRQSRKSVINSLSFNGKLIELGSFADVFCESPTDDDELSFELIFDNSEILDICGKYTKGMNAQTEIPVSCSSFPLPNSALFGDDSFLYLSADRINPRDYYPTDKTAIDNRHLGNTGAYAPHYFHIHKNDNILIKELAFDSSDKILSLEAQLNRWLSVVSPNIKVGTQINDNLVRLSYSYKTKLATTKDCKPKNAGFGLTYVFSVLVAILSSRKGDIIVIENPESHIHPKGQAELSRLLVLAAASGVQVFVETHSDHILYGLRIAIKDKLISKDQASVYYLDRDEEEYFSNAFFIEIDEFGRMKRDVRKYFREYEYYLDKLMY